METSLASTSSATEPMKRRHAILTLGAALVASVMPSESPEAAEQKYPDVLAAKVRAVGKDVFDFDVTVSSPYDSARRYADGLRARSSEGRVYGERKLVHDHASEQPFTRDMYGVKVPVGITSVVIEARDQKYGYGGKTVVVVLPGR
ncbi:MAG: hypothetical protein ABIV63_18355 [Caldimonas sp.]